MTSIPTLLNLDWNQLLGLRVVRKIVDLIGRRWQLHFGYIDVARSEVCFNFPCPMPGPHALCHACETHKHGLLEHFKASTVSNHSLVVSHHNEILALATPIFVNSLCLGAIYFGSYRVEEGAANTSENAVPTMSNREVLFITDLAEEAAVEISGFLESESIPVAITGDAQPSNRDRFGELIGSAPSMVELYTLLDKVVKSESTVLVTGENGTGKELVAKAIHTGSVRKNNAFVLQNCSAFNDNLLDSELFGHKRGAFTGAVTDKKGLFEVADKGTFFLDEIGDMSPSLQVKVLRVLQEGTFTPVGDTTTKHVDVRIIAATNRDLSTMVDQGSFRKDLFYRINVINIELPALRDRCEDIELLTQYFLVKHNGAGKRLSPDCLAKMRGYLWPGNVRELENEIERLVVLAGDANLLGAKDLSERIRDATSDPFGAQENRGSLPEAVMRLERRMIREALLEHGGNKTRAAIQLKVSRRNLIRLAQKYGL